MNYVLRLSRVKFEKKTSPNSSIRGKDIVSSPVTQNEETKVRKEKA